MKQIEVSQKQLGTLVSVCIVVLFACLLYLTILPSPNILLAVVMMFVAGMGGILTAGALNRVTTINAILKDQWNIYLTPEMIKQRYPKVVTDKLIPYLLVGYSEREILVADWEKGFTARFKFEDHEAIRGVRIYNGTVQVWLYGKDEKYQDLGYRRLRAPDFGFDVEELENEVPTT